MPSTKRPRPIPPLPCQPPTVVERRGRRTLEFVPGEVQSEMLVARPARLMLAYTRAIMCFALFVPRPRHIVMVGLGGGSLVKFCYRHFPHTRLTVLELRADVIALRSQFAIPPDDARLRVVHTDAALWLAGQREAADVIVLDGFDQAGPPAALASARFFGDCQRALCSGGVLVANIFTYDPAYRATLARLGARFDQRLCWFDGVAGNNRILFALKGPAPASASVAGRWQRWLARHEGLGCAVLNQALVLILIMVLSRPNGTKRQHLLP